MDLTNQLLDLLRESLHYFRFLICLLITFGFLKTILTMWFNLQVKKLEHKSHYEIHVDGSRKSVNMTTSQPIEFRQIEPYLLNSPILLDEPTRDSEKKSA